MIPTFKEAERAAINGTGTALGKFIIMFTPASKEDEKNFREQLEAVLAEAQIIRKKNAKLRTYKSPARRKPRSRKHG